MSLPLTVEGGTAFPPALFFIPSLSLDSNATLFFNVAQVKPSSSFLGIGWVNKLIAMITATVTRNSIIPRGK